MLPIIRTENAREETGFGEIVSLVSDILSLSIYGCIQADMPSQLLDIWIQNSGKFWDNDKLPMSYVSGNPCLFTRFGQVLHPECCSWSRVPGHKARH